MIASPRAAAISSATRRRSSDAVPTMTTSAPSASTRARLSAGESDGITITAGHAEQAGRPRDALGVVARRVGDQPAAALLRGQRRGRDVGAAQLERADGLERLRLEPVAALGAPERDQRRADGDPAQDDARPRGSRRARRGRGRGCSPVIGGGRSASSRCRARSRAGPRGAPGGSGFRTTCSAP